MPSEEHWLTLDGAIADARRKVQQKKLPAGAVVVVVDGKSARKVAEVTPSGGVLHGP
jgi:hypothetical protein